MAGPRPLARLVRQRLGVHYAEHDRGRRAGPEAVIPLDQRGGEFLGDVLARSVDLCSSPTRSGGVSIFKTQVDHSTNFTGPITVQATNPADLDVAGGARQGDGSKPSGPDRISSMISAFGVSTMERSARATRGIAGRLAQAGTQVVR